MRPVPPEPMQPGAAFPGFEAADAPDGVGFRSGKVRDIFDLGEGLLICASDRISAFDRILGLVPAKGEVLTRMSAWWFERIDDIVPHHLIATPTARSMHVRTCGVLPVEVVVRGYLTGSAWRDYQAGRAVSGIELPRGLRFNQRFDQPLVTPSTKEEGGAHDRPISAAEVVSLGLVDSRLWQQVEQTALALYERGRQICATRGLILVDTKYEFGVRNGELTLVDEVHTCDSSRFWYADGYQELYDKGERQRKLDKEYLRQWLMDQGFQGHGDAPRIPVEVFSEVAARYASAYEVITGSKFLPSGESVEAERRNVLLYVAELQRKRGEDLRTAT